MTVVRLTRFTIDPVDTDTMLTTRSALVAVARQAFPGLRETQLAKIDEQRWLDLWTWDSFADAEDAIAAAPTIPEAGAAFALTSDVTVEFAEIIDEIRA
jgi:hypothetical protein